MRIWIRLFVILWIIGLMAAGGYRNGVAAPVAGGIDLDAVFAKTNPRAVDIQSAVDLAVERLSAPQFADYKSRFKGKTVEWRGIVYDKAQHGGKVWVLVCTACPNGVLTNYDTLFILPADGGADVKRGQEIGFRGDIEKVVGNPELGRMIGQGSIGYKVVLSGVRMQG
ncbi:MAG: hypothetical protein ACLGPL_11795 [Acidobacteriota bacterium]